MIMAKNSNNNYVKIEDIEAKNNNEYQDIEKIVSKQGNLLYNKYKEIENIPPITFKGKGKNLENYRIYGNMVGGESVGDRTGNLFDMKKFAETCFEYGATVNYTNNTLTFTATGIDAYVNAALSTGKVVPLQYRSSCIDVLPSTTYTISMSSAPRCFISWVDSSFNVVSIFTAIPTNATSYTFTTPENCTKLLIRLGKHVTNIGDTFTISDIMLNSGSTPLPYEPYGYRVPVTVEGKNLLRNTTTSQTYGGVMVTVNSDGSMTCNGTATTHATLRINIGEIPSGIYKLSGCPKNGAYNTYRLDVRDSSDAVIVLDTGNGHLFNSTNAHHVELRIEKGYTCENLTFYPMIRRADIEDDTYEPYHAPVTTNLYLPEPIKMVGDEAEYVDYKEQKMHRVRKNLLNIETDIIPLGFQYGTVTIFNDLNVKGFFKECEPNTAYTISRKTSSNNNRFSIGFTSIKPKNGLTQSLLDYTTPLDTLATSLTLTSPAEARYVCCYLSNINEDITPDMEIMLEKNDRATDYEPYITNTELDVTLPALPTLSGTNTLSVGTEVQPSKVYLKGKLKGKIYGWHVDPDISDSSNAVTYLKDAVGMTPAAMGSSTFDYGSWENAFFMPKPCMLKSNGKVDYYLDPDDYTKKLDGTASDISNPNYDGNAMMQWPKIWFKYVKGVKEGQGYFYVANYKADGNYHCWCNYDSEDNEIDHFYTAIYNGTSFMNYSASKTYVVNDFAVYDNKLYKCNTAITTAQAFDSTKWDIVSNTAPAINKMRSLSGIRLTNNNGNAQTNTTTEVTRAEANNTTAAKEWYIETFSDRLLINGLLVLMGKSLNTQAIFGRGLDTGGQSAKEAYVTGTLNDKGLFWGVTENGNSVVKVFGMENFWGYVWHRTAGLITNNHAIKLKLTYGTKDGSTVVGYNQTGNGYIDNGISPYANGYVQKMSYNKYGFIPAVVTGGSQSTYYADYHYQNENYTGVIYALFGGVSGYGLAAGAFCLVLSAAPGIADWSIAASLSCKPISLFN